MCDVGQCRIQGMRQRPPPFKKYIYNIWDPFCLQLKFKVCFLFNIYVQYLCFRRHVSIFHFLPPLRSLFMANHATLPPIKSLDPPL